MHKLLAKQMKRARACGEASVLDTLLPLIEAAYEEADRDRRRTERSLTLMADELETFARGLEAQVVARTVEVSAVRAQLEATFEAMDQGVLMCDAAGFVQLFNRRACELLGLDAALLTARPSFASLPIPRRFNSDDEACDIRVGPRLIEVAASPLRDGGWARTYTDVTRRREREEAIRRAEAEFRSLFENAFVGIYRASLDGRIQRVNPAFARLHGFADEAGFLAAFAQGGADLYVDGPRRADFMRAVREEGRVTDCTSQVRRLADGERIWVTESAWVVQNSHGVPLRIEGTLVDATPQRISQQRIAYLAHHDPLTGLANREAFHDALRKLETAMAQGERVAIHCIDLDRFKYVNDTYGHPVGDALLRAVGRRLRHAARGCRLIARLGGDEFAVVQTGLRDATEAEATALRLRERLATAFRVGDHLLQVGASVGYAIGPDHGTTSDQLFPNADLALCAAKQTRGVARAWDVSLSEHAVSRRLLETDLRIAWADRRFHLVFQPIVCVDGERPADFEALLRWNDPKRGPVSPADFVPLAEEIGLISQIGEFVIETACRQVAAFDARASVSVNVSPIQFRDRTLLPAVRRALQKTGLAPERLVLEVTESLLLEDSESTKTDLAALRAMGVRLALDDFGIGYSALGYLERFQFDVVKIDRTFIARLDESSTNAAIVRAVIEIGRAIDMEVVAEGVETFEQFERLRAMGCDKFQGFYFGRPGDLAAPAHAGEAEPRRRSA